MNAINWEIKKILKNGDKATTAEIVELLLENRSINQEKKEDFFNPINPLDIDINDLKISSRDLSKALKRVKAAIEKKEKIIVFGDYDADGVSACGILWETLYSLGADALPYIPERFSEGYAIRFESVEKLKAQYPNLKLVITVDNGVVAKEAIKKINSLDIDVIVTDHHQIDEELPSAYSIIHSTLTSGSGVAWFFARELAKKIDPQKWKNISQSSIDLAAIGTIADQLPLLSINRSIAVYGINALRNTKRLGLQEIIKSSGIDFLKLGVYEINFVLAPRINSMGRLTHAMDALRLLCTTNNEKAINLARVLDKTNLERQNILEEVILHAKNSLDINDIKVITIAHESYHEGVIGLAASRLVEAFYRPAIVFSRGEKLSKASARSIPGFNIIEAIRELSYLYVEGGGHPMAAGFTIETDKIPEFQNKFLEISSKYLTQDILDRKISVDTVLSFNQLNWDLLENIEKFSPFGVGNPAPIFVTYNVAVKKCKPVGREGNHLKLLLSSEGREYDAIAFGLGQEFPGGIEDQNVDIAYYFEKNLWNGSESMQLRIKNLRSNG